MSDLEKFYIPKYLDEPFRLLFWTVDESIFLFIPIGLGIHLGYTVTGIFLGVIGLLSWKRAKGGDDSNKLQSLLYWHFPSSFCRLKVTPASYQRFFLG